MKHQVTITSNGTGTGNSSIHLDGRDISKGVREVDFHGAVGEADTVNLELIVFDGTRIDSDEAEVIIPDETRKALEALGWTPPEEG